MKPTKEQLLDWADYIADDAREYGSQTYIELCSYLRSQAEQLEADELPLTDEQKKEGAQFVIDVINFCRQGTIPLAVAEKLAEACEKLANAADFFAADQSRATDKRCGLVQPITVAEGEALNVALRQAFAALAEYRAQEKHP